METAEDALFVLREGAMRAGATSRREGRNMDHTTEARKLNESFADIADNQAFIPDYGDRHRNGERISSAFAESAVNQLVSRRMIKRQQMHWTKRGAHLLLQVRAQVMNGDLRNTFRRWYPGMKAASEDQLSRAA